MPLRALSLFSIRQKLEVAAASALLYFILAWLGLNLKVSVDAVPAIWFPNAVMVVLGILLRPPLLYILVPGFLGNILANLLAGDEPTSAVGMAAANSVEIAIATLLASRLIKRPRDIQDFRTLIAFLGISGLAAVSSGLMAAPYLGEERLLPVQIWNWWLADAMALMTIAPILLVLEADRREARARREPFLTIGATIEILVACIPLFGVFYQTSYPFLFLAAPVVMIVAARRGNAASAVLLLCLMVIATVMTMMGRGPIYLMSEGVHAKAAVLEIFIFSTFVSTLPFVLATERIETMRARTASLLETMEEIAFSVDMRGHWSFLSRNAQAIFGSEEALPLDQRALKLVPRDNRRDLLDGLRQLLRGEMEELEFTTQLASAEAPFVYLRARIRVQYSRDGLVAGFVGLLTDVSSETIAKQALEHSQRRVALLTERAPVGIFEHDAKGNCVYLNPAWLAMTGLTREEALGEGWKRSIHAEDVIHLPRWHEQREATGLMDAEMRMVRPDGQIRWIRVVAHAIREDDGPTTGYIGVVVDLTGEREARQAELATLRNLNLLTENAPVGIFQQDQSGKIIYINPAFRQMLEIDSDENLAEKLTDVLHPDDAAKVAEWRAIREKEGKLDIEVRYQWPNGRVVRARIVSQALLDANGEISGYIGVVVDQTREFNAREAMKAAIEEARQAAGAKDRFLAQMSHELRTPMNGVLGFAERLAETKLDDKQERFVSLIAQSGEIMMHLLNDVLDTTRMREGEVHLAHQPFDPGRAIAQLCAHFEPLAARRGISLTCIVAPDVPAQILGDEQRFRQILTNLLGNALKFTQEGRISINAFVSGSGDGEQLAVDVTDSGIGILAEARERIFEPFGQASSETSLRYGGTGLGLPIARGLAERMGGTLELASSRIGAGSTFRLIFPVERADQSQIVPPPADDVPEKRARRTRAKNRGTSARVLVAEDNEINQVLIGEILQQIGCETTMVANGQEAVDEIGISIAQGRPFDLVLMDLRMPVLDGLGATRAIRSGGIDAGQLPIVAITADIHPDAISACRDAGMQDYLSKPVSRGAVSAALKNWTSGTPARREQGPDGGARINPALRDLLPAFVEQCELTLAQLDDVLQATPDRHEASLADARKSAHTLAGLAASFGAQSLVIPAQQLDLAAEDPRNPKLESRISALRKQLKTYLENIK